jgi:hypothetical protein
MNVVTATFIDARQWFVPELARYQWQLRRQNMD